MDSYDIKRLLIEFKEGKISLENALKHLSSFPLIDLGFAVLDTHRSLRRGFPEIIFGEGKSTEQIVKIVKSFLNTGENIMITRLNDSTGRKLMEIFENKEIEHNELARTIVIRQKPIKRIGKNPVLILSAGTSDIPVAEEAFVTSSIMGNVVEKGYDVGVSGIHRLLNKRDILLNAGVIIVVAGMEGALPSVVAGLVSCPVIAVPTSVGYGASFKGISALLTMLNSCAGGVLVVNIDNGFGAGLAASIINRQVYVEE